MADIAWVRKYRPSSFEDYMGDDVKRLVLNRFADRNAIPNTIMLYGTRGTGKTSMARLLCKEIHCQNPVDGHSCGVCDMCQEIDTYITSTEAGTECFGVTEVDAATTTGKNDINDIIEDALVPPMYPLEYKVIIMDECHMLSVAAQNSLLKVVEEPPKHLVFILCTTDPEKVIGTIHSRMQLKLEVKKKTVEEMAQRLQWICSKEGIKTSIEALRIIAKKGDRIPRECINLLESVAKNFGNEVTIQNVMTAIGDVSNEIYVEYFQAANKGISHVLSVNTKIKEKDINPREFFKGLTSFVIDLMYIKHGMNLDDYSPDFTKLVNKLCVLPNGTKYKSSHYDALLQIMDDVNRHLDSDDTKGELMIITTALKIARIDRVAEDFKNQTKESKDFSTQFGSAKDENISSIRNYQSILDSQRKSALEKIPNTDPKKESFIDLFPHMVDVKGGLEGVDSQIQAEGVEEAEDTDPNLLRIMELFNSSGTLE